MRLFPALALLLCAAPAAAQSDAYRDPRAQELVRLARARRAVVDTRITAYETTAHERLSARMAVAGAERLLFRRETAARIAWTPDTVRIEVLGAREAQPLASAAAQLPPASLASMVPALAFDPVDSEMLLRFDSTVIRHPLAPGSEAHYRFASGDSARIRLPDGRAVRLLELRIAARRPDRRLINGAFWLDAETHAVVRAAFRLSQGYSSSRSGVTMVAPEFSGEVDHVAIEYGLWDFRWWLPRTIVARGVVRVAGMRLPLAYDRRYEGYRVEGDTASAAVLATRPSPGLDPLGPEEDGRRCRRRVRGSISINVGAGSPAGRDSAWEAEWREAAAAVAAGDSADAADDRCARVFVVSRAEGVDLVDSPEFEGSIYDEGEGPVSEADLRGLSELLREVPGSPWAVGRPGLRVLTPELVRYNRVEGLSLGARATLPLGPAELRAELRAGTTGEIGGRLSGIHSSPGLRTELAAYRGLEAVQVASQPFSLASSAGAFFLGRDENDYFRGTGAELRFSPPAARSQRWDLRLFAERQEAVEAETDGSLRGWIDGGFEVRENLPAERLEQAGATLRLRAARGDDPAGLRARAELELHGETGDRAFGRPLLRLGADGLLGGGVGFGLGLAAGTAFGDVPVQRAWQIGGATTVRGHDPAALRGESLWLARAELTRGDPGFRLSLFGDAGWAGPSEEVWNARPLTGVGIGAAFLDNLVRVDLAHGLGDGGGLRLHLRMGGGL